MPRQARLDAPNALHHIIIRGIDRRVIFTDDSDRENFLDRLSDLLMDNHQTFTSAASCSPHTIPPRKTRSLSHLKAIK